MTFMCLGIRISTHLLFHDRLSLTKTKYGLRMSVNMQVQIWVRIRFELNRQSYSSILKIAKLSAFKILVRKHKGKRPLTRPMDKSIILLKWMLKQRKSPQHLLIWIHRGTSGSNETRISKNGGKFLRLAGELLASEQGFFLVTVRHETGPFKATASFRFTDIKTTQE